MSVAESGITTPNIGVVVSSEAQRRVSMHVKTGVIAHCVWWVILKDAWRGWPRKVLHILQNSMPAKDLDPSTTWWCLWVCWFAHKDLREASLLVPSLTLYVSWLPLALIFVTSVRRSFGSVSSESWAERRHGIPGSKEEVGLELNASFCGYDVTCAAPSSLIVQHGTACLCNADPCASLKPVRFQSLCHGLHTLGPSHPAFPLAVPTQLCAKRCKIWIRELAHVECGVFTDCDSDDVELRKSPMPWFGNSLLSRERSHGLSYCRVDHQRGGMQLGVISWRVRVWQLRFYSWLFDGCDICR